jgi:predicted transcriptional regulator
MLNIPFEPHVIGEFGLYEKPIENIIDDTLSSPGKLILMGNINSFYIFSGYENQYEICFETNISAFRNKPVIVLNPNIDKIILEGINTIYVFDNLIDYKSILNVRVSDKGINCVICSLSADNDIEYINTLKPSIIDINCTYEYLKASMVNGIYNCTIDILSHRLSFNKFKTYYSLRILHEMRMISVAMMGSSGLSIKLGSFDCNRIEDSLRFAAALVSLKMGMPGPFRGTREDVFKFKFNYF